MMWYVELCFVYISNVILRHDVIFDILVDPSCTLCNSGRNSTHLFFECNFARALWASACWGLRIDATAISYTWTMEENTITKFCPLKNMLYSQAILL